MLPDRLKEGSTRTLTVSVRIPQNVNGKNQIKLQFRFETLTSNIYGQG